MRWIERWFRRGARLWVLVLLIPLLVGVGEPMAGSVAGYVKSTWPELTTKKVSIAAEVEQKGLAPVMLRMSGTTPLVEELKYRFLPFYALAGLWAMLGKGSPSASVMVTMVLATSVVFGYIHGGIGNILIQGPLGLMFAVVFLKWSAYLAKPVTGFAAAFALHSIYNLAVVLDRVYLW